MWSVIQQRRLRRETAARFSSKNQPGDENPTLDDPENPEPKPPSSAPDLSSHDGKVFVKTTGQDDPIDPHNWPLGRRCINIAIVAYLSFVQTWAGAAESMANSTASTEEGHSKVAENLTVALYLIGFGSGSVLVGPVSETFGRNPIYLVPTFCFMCFVLGAALAPTFAGRMVCRFFMGWFASGTMTINGSSVEDMFRPVKRAMVFPIIAWINVATPMLAPIASGWTVENPHLGWRWNEWFTLIFTAPAFLLTLFFLPETYLPLLLDWKATGLRRATGDRRYVSEHAESTTLKQRMKDGLLLTPKYFFTEPVILVLGLYLTLLWILHFTFLSGFEFIFEQKYNLSTGQTGSCFGAIAAGTTVCTFLTPVFYRWTRRKTGHVKRAFVAPELRLWPSIVAGPLLPASLFWLGWGNYSSISIWCSLGACFLYGAAMIAIYVSSYEYIIDSYGQNSATALSSITFVRYIIAGGMVMAARPMYSGIGVHWTMTLLGCIAVILAPAPLIFLKYGSNLREKSPYAVSPEDES